MAKKRSARVAEKTADIEQQLVTKTTIPSKSLLSTGSTLLNINLTGQAKGGLKKGSYFLLIGGSTSGKTFLGLTCLAEASVNPEFVDYRFIFDDAEDGALMNMEKYFGEKMASKLEPPRRDADGNPVYSELIEDLYYNLDDAVQKGVPFIYIIDSIDALSSKSEHKKFDENKKARRDGKEGKGDYGDGKAKVNSRFLRRVVGDIRKMGSILIVINQERDNPDAGLFQSKKTHSGGRALKFYATAEIWFSSAGAIKKEIKGKPRRIGNMTRIDIKKNRYTGRDRSCTIPIYYSHGIDDITSCIEYLVEEGAWKKARGGVIDTKGDLSEQPLRMQALIAHIEENNLEGELAELVQKTWDEIEAKCVVPRKKRY